jgi:hypothetical protein
MKVTLTVSVENNGKRETLVDASYEVDESIAGLEKEASFLLLNSVTTKMLLDKAHETQTMMMDKVKETIIAIDTGMKIRNMAAMYNEENNKD